MANRFELGQDGAVSRQKPPPRASRRTRARDHGRLVRDLERLARLEPGGAPDRPLDVESPSQVEVMAAGRPCPLCKGTLRLEEHAAATVGTRCLRVAHLRCTGCRVQRSLYFRLVERLN